MTVHEQGSRSRKKDQQLLLVLVLLEGSRPPT
jgi:hypothetical protein